MFQMNFLESGHTHIDVDGVFGILSQKLQRQDAWTLDEMMSLFEESAAAHADKTKKMAEAGKGDDRMADSIAKATALYLESVPDFKALYNMVQISPSESHI